MASSPRMTVMDGAIEPGKGPKPVSTPTTELVPTEKTEVVTTTGEVQLPTPAAETTTTKGEAPASALSIDSVSKTLAVVLVVLYVVGFLITSLHNFRYGFSEMNPLRPRILAAGGWFAMFLAVPAALVWELRRHSAISEKSSHFSRLSTLIAAYMGSAILMVSSSDGLFLMDTPLSGQHLFWRVSLIMLVAIVVLAAAFAIGSVPKSRMSRNTREVLSNYVVLLFYGYFFAASCYNLFAIHHFDYSAVYFWFLLMGGYVYFELSRRQWKLVIGAWQRTLVCFFVLMTMFATVYYPHIKAQWGGGAPISIEITLSKDAPVQHPGSVVECSLIDETDAGYFVIEKGNSSATFVPRSEISSIYYGQGKQNSVFTQVPQPATK